MPAPPVAPAFPARRCAPDRVRVRLWGCGAGAQADDRVLFEPASARYLKKVSTQEKKWRSRESKRSASAVKKTFGMAMYDVKKFPSPLLMTMELHMLAKKKKGIDQTLHHLNRYFWFATAGKGLKSSALLDLITSEDQRLRWCARATARAR